MLHRLLMRFIQWYLAKSNLIIVRAGAYGLTETIANDLHAYCEVSGFLTNKQGRHYRAAQRVRSFAWSISKGLQHARVPTW